MQRRSRMLVAVVPLALFAWGCGPGADGIDYRVAGVLDSGGGMLQTADLTIESAPGAIFDAVRFEVTPTEMPAPLPEGLVPVGSPVDISVDDQDRIGRPVTISMRYDDRGIPDEESMLVFHYDQEIGYEAVTLLAHDTEANVITFESLLFSPFVITFENDELPTHFDVGFRADEHGWRIENFASAFSDGHCWGMAAYSVWCFDHCGDNLYHKYDTETATLTAMRAHLAQSQHHAEKQYDETHSAMPHLTGRAIRSYLVRTEKPLCFEACSDHACHALVVYGYTPTSFLLYDNNHPGVEKQVGFNGNYFGRYANIYKDFGYLARPSWGRTEDFGNLTAQAEGGFRQADHIQIIEPENTGEVVTVPSSRWDIWLHGRLTGLNRHAKLFLVADRLSNRWTPVFRNYDREFWAGHGGLTDELKVGTTRLHLIAGIMADDLWDYQSSQYRNMDNIVVEVVRLAPEETDCYDGIDNDGDGSTDCDDEDCACADPCGAVPVRCGEVIQDTTVGGSHLIDVHSGCSDWDDTGPERIYVLRDAEPGTVHANIVAMQEGTDLDVFVHEDGCAPESCKEAGQHEAWCGVDPGKTYYIVVDGHQGDAGSFTLEIDCL